MRGFKWVCVLVEHVRQCQGLALHKARLVFASGLYPQGSEVDLRLQLPGAGFLLCTGGFSQAAALPVQTNAGVVVPVPTAEERQRVGSLRRLGMVAKKWVCA